MRALCSGRGARQVDELLGCSACEFNIFIVYTYTKLVRAMPGTILSLTGPQSKKKRVPKQLILVDVLASVIFLCPWYASGMLCKFTRAWTSGGWLSRYFFILRQVLRLLSVNPVLE